MRKKKRIPVSIMLLVFLFLLTGCTLGGTKQEAETKVDYYIGVVDDNAPYYYEEDGLPKGYYADFVAAMAKEEPFTYKFVPVDASSYNENLSKKSIDGLSERQMHPQVRIFWQVSHSTHLIFVF